MARAFRSPESYSAEAISRGMLVSFLRERGFTEVDDRRKRFGQTESQTIHARAPTGIKCVMSVRLCWRKDAGGEGIKRSAAQLLATVDKTDWIGSLKTKISREKGLGVTHILLVQ